MKKILLGLCKQEFTRLDVICFSISWSSCSSWRWVCVLSNAKTAPFIGITKTSRAKIIIIDLVLLVML